MCQMCAALSSIQPTLSEDLTLGKFFSKVLIFQILDEFLPLQSRIGTSVTIGTDSAQRSWQASQP